jgi:hypothetical protein
LLLHQQPKIALTPSLSHRALQDASSGGSFAPVEINIFTRRKKFINITTETILG